MKYYLPDYNFAVEKYKAWWIMLHKGSDAVLATTPEQTEAILQWAENNKKKYDELVKLSLKELGAHLQIRWNKKRRDAAVSGRVRVRWRAEEG